MKTIKSKVYAIYGMIFLALTMTVMGAFIAVDTQQQHLVLTELLSKQKLLVERVTSSTINMGELGLVDKDRFKLNLDENSTALFQYMTTLDFMLKAFEEKEYPIDGKIVKLKFSGQFESVFDSALLASMHEWEETKSSIAWLLNPDNLKDKLLYAQKLDAFRILNFNLIEHSDYLTKICREEAGRKRITANTIQAVSVSGALLIFVFMTYMMNRDFKKPLHEIQEVFSKMGKGQFNVRLTRERNDEFKVLFDNFNHFADSLVTIRKIEQHVLREDSLNDVLPYIKEVFRDFADFDKLSIVYQDAHNQILSITVEEDTLLEEQFETLELFEYITKKDDNTIVLPIKIHEAYLGYAQFESNKKFDHSAIKFIETLGPTLSFVFYKDLLFRDLLAIVTDGLADLAESRDPETRLHLKRMSTYSQLIAKQLSQTDRYKDIIDEEFIANIKLTSPMHDIGKISVPDYVLLKPAKLSDEEFEIMKTHAHSGAMVLKRIHNQFIRYNLSYFDMAADIALGHQEKFNGSGYPKGISGADIPLAARISALADVFDALTSKRPYKEAFSLEKSYEIINDSIGSHFDPDVVAAFYDTIDAIESTYEQYHEI